VGLILYIFEASETFRLSVEMHRQTVKVASSQIKNKQMVKLRFEESQQFYTSPFSRKSKYRSKTPKKPPIAKFVKKSLRETPFIRKS
jgi:hypothetical protein